MKIKEELGLAQRIHDSRSDATLEIQDHLARRVKQDFDAAVRHRNTVSFGDATADEVLHRCYNQYFGEIPCDIKKAFGNMPSVNLSQLKISALNAWLRDLIFGSGGIPFAVEPTPVPELSDSMVEEVLIKVKDVLFGGQGDMPSTRAELQELIDKEKYATRELMIAKAKEASKLMETEMWDQCVEGGFKKAVLKFLQDFCIYPYAVLEGPTPEIRTRMVWQGDSLKAKDEVIYAVNRVSPFDFFWSPDSTNAQDGSYVIIRKRYSKQQLMKMASLPSYIQENVIAALEHFANRNTSVNWLSPNPEEGGNIISWDGNSPLEVLKYHGAVKGEILKEYGVKGVEDNEYYECIIHTLGHFTLKVIINPNPNANVRPVFVTSYETTGNGVMGFGIAQKIRDTERAFHACLRGMIKNMEYSSGPIGEVDFTRIAQWVEDGKVGEVEPYTLNPTDPDPVGGGRPAYVFHNFPNYTGALSNVCQWFMSLADIVTQIPASIHGQPVGTGANRTFRGMSMLYGNALKGVQSGITNFDEDVISPFAESLYMLNLKFNPKKEIKGDAKVVARGASGLMERELKKNDMIEAAQIVIGLGQTGRVQPGTLDKAIDRVLEALDLADENAEKVLRSIMGEESLDLSQLAPPQQGGVTPQTEATSQTPQTPQV